MQIKEIMTPNVEVVGPDDTLQAAAKKMRDLDVGAIPVRDGEKVHGILTDRDITVRAVAQGLDPRSTPTASVMTREICWCYEDASVEEAEKLLSDNQIRRILVMDRDQQLVGIVSLGDLATETNQPQDTAMILEHISQKTVPVGRAA